MKQKLFTFTLLFFLLTTSTFSFEVSAGLEGILYEESFDTYSRVNGETLRWEMKREFLLRDYEEITYSRGGIEVLGIQMEVISDTQNGQYETVIQPFLGMNFELEVLSLNNGAVSEFRWEMYMFRNKDLYRGFPNEFFVYSNRHFDLENEKNFFSVNLEYTEFLNQSGKIQEIKVNTELSTKNNDDGRVTRTAVHMIKRDNDEIIYDYNWVINEVSTVYRYINLLDQPFLYVPLQIAAVFLLVYLYLRFHRFWVDNDIRIIRGKNKIITIEQIEEESNTDDTTSSDPSEKENED